MVGVLFSLFFRFAVGRSNEKRPTAETFVLGTRSQKELIEEVTPSALPLPLPFYRRPLFSAFTVFFFVLARSGFTFELETTFLTGESGYRIGVHLFEFRI